MILPSQEIERLSKGQTHGLIHPFDEANLRASSYDLTVGEEYYIGEEGASSTLSTQLLKPRQSFTIPPHAVCFILAAESIHLPDDVTAKVSLRMTHIYAGMVLTSQPPFDPRYHGRVVVMLHNLSSVAFHLKCGERVATIEFMRVEETPHKSKAHRSVTTLEEQLPKPFVSSLTEIASMAKSSNKKVNWLSGQMLIFSALIVAVLAVPGFFSYSSLLDRLGEQKGQLKEMSQTLEGYKREQEQYRRTTSELEKRLDDMVQKTAAPPVDTPSLQRGAERGRM